MITQMASGMPEVWFRSIERVTRSSTSGHRPGRTSPIVESRDRVPRSTSCRATVATMPLVTEAIRATEFARAGAFACRPRVPEAVSKRPAGPTTEQTAPTAGHCTTASRASWIARSSRPRPERGFGPCGAATAEEAAAEGSARPARPAAMPWANWRRVGRIEASFRRM